MPLNNEVTLLLLCTKVCMTIFLEKMPKNRVISKANREIACLANKSAVMIDFLSRYCYNKSQIDINTKIVISKYGWYDG